MKGTESTRIYLVRHGETEWGRDGNRYCGRTDVPLNRTGLQQAGRVSSALGDVPLTAVYASPLERAVTTARSIAELHRIDVRPVDRMIEIDFGRWDGMRRDEIERDDSQHWSKWLRNPAETAAGHTGETATQAVERAMSSMESLASRHRGESIAIVAHNTLNRLLIAKSLGMPLANYRLLSQSYCGVSMAERSGATLRWITINETGPF